MIHLTPSAIAEIKRLMATRPNSAQAFCRLRIQAGGCADFYYSLGVDLAIAADEIVVERNNIQIVLDSQTQSYINDLTIDYSEDLMGGGFRFHNPDAIKTCGCGNSFSLA